MVGLAVMLLTQRAAAAVQPGAGRPGGPRDGAVDLLDGPAQRLDRRADSARAPAGAQLQRDARPARGRAQRQQRPALAAQEAERHRIAQELHDEVGQSLTVVLLGLKRLEPRAPAELVDELALLRESARASLDDVRRVARELRPGVLEDLGLLSALAALATDFTAARRGRRYAVLRARPARPCRRDRAGGLPGRPGGADQRRPARRRAHRSSCRCSASATRGARGRRRRRGLRRRSSAGAGIRGMRERALLVGGDRRRSPAPPAAAPRSGSRSR